jgi:taurine dioxygenase
MHPFLPSRADAPEVIVFEKSEDVAGYENAWHADVTWREVPSLGSVLRAVEVPDVGGDTLFADMHAAYVGLRDEVKQRIDGLRAVHDFTRHVRAHAERCRAGEEAGGSTRRPSTPWCAPTRKPDGRRSS